MRYGRESCRERFRTSRLLIPLLVVVMVAGACSGSEGGNGAEGGAGGDRSSLTVGVPVDMNGLDGNSLSDRPGRFIRANVYSTLVARDADNAIVPNVLTEWKYDQSKLTWTLTMRDDIVFDNGEAATSEDLKATIDRMSNPDHPSTYEDWWDAAETTIVDEYTVAVRLNEDNPLLLIRGDGYYLNSKTWIEEAGPDLYAGSEPPPGSGPYKIVEWRQDDQIIMEASDTHWAGRPPIDDLIFRIVPDDAARVAGLRSGEMDVVFPIPPALAASITGDEFEVVPVTGTSRIRLLMDTREAPFNDIRVREALNLAIDRDVIIDELLPGSNKTPGMVIVDEVGFDPDLPYYEYDPERARELLAEAGYPDGFGPIEMSVNDERLYSGDEHLVVAEQLAAVGVKVDVRVYPTDDFDSRLIEDSLGPLLYHGHSGGQTWNAAFTLEDVQPCGPTGVSEHEEHWQFCNTEAADLIQEGISVWASDENRSIELFQQADQILHDDYAMIPLWQPVDNYGLRSDLNWEPNPSLYMAAASWD